MCIRDRSWNNLRWPSNIRCDGGPQFLGPFRSWCQENSITHELASPYNPKSNGLAEAGVKIVKTLLSKCNKGRPAKSSLPLEKHPKNRRIQPSATVVWMLTVHIATSSRKPLWFFWPGKKTKHSNEQKNTMTFKLPSLNSWKWEISQQEVGNIFFI